MSYSPTELIEVLAWGRTVGAVAADDASQSYAFEYDPDWAAGAVELAPLHMPNGSDIYTFPGLAEPTYHRLPPALADALPDRFGNSLIDSWMATNGVDPTSITALDRLAYTADRAMGALEFRPPAATPSVDATAIALADLVTVARQTLAGKLSDDAETRQALEQLISVGTSAGGARAKAVIAYHPVTGQIRSGQLDAPDGYEHWLLKLDGVDGDPSGEPTLAAGRSYGIVEYAYHRMAVDAGIEMSECRLLPEGPRTHFLTRRFDRTDQGERLHMISLCGLAHLDFNQAGAHGYEQYLQTVRALDLGTDAIEQAFRRVVFNVAAVNRDDHTKNLAFLCDDRGAWSLAPAFDVTYAWNPSGAWTASHQMTVCGKRDAITGRDLRELADRYAVPGYRQALAEVLDAVSRWAEHAEEAGLDPERTEAIASAHRLHRPT